MLISSVGQESVDWNNLSLSLRRLQRVGWLFDDFEKLIGEEIPRNRACLLLHWKSFQISNDISPGELWWKTVPSSIVTDYKKKRKKNEYIFLKMREKILATPANWIKSSSPSIIILLLPPLNPSSLFLARSFLCCISLAPLVVYLHDSGFRALRFHRSIFRIGTELIWIALHIAASNSQKSDLINLKEEAICYTNVDDQTSTKTKNFQGNESILNE